MAPRDDKIKTHVLLLAMFKSRPSTDHNVSVLRAKCNAKKKVGAKFEHSSGENYLILSTIEKQ